MSHRLLCRWIDSFKLTPSMIIGFSFNLKQSVVGSDAPWGASLCQDCSARRSIFERGFSWTQEEFHWSLQSTEHFKKSRKEITGQQSIQAGRLKNKTYNSFQNQQKRQSKPGKHRLAPINALRKESWAMTIHLEINHVQSPFIALVRINSWWLCVDNLIVIQGYSSLNPIRTRRTEVLNRD